MTCAQGPSPLARGSPIHDDFHGEWNYVISPYSVGRKRAFSALDSNSMSGSIAAIGLS